MLYPNLFKSMEGSKEFPSDMVFEVLTRTSLKTLDACKCVCKEWRQLIHNPTFMPTYCKKTENVYGFILQGIYDCRYTSTFVSVDQSGEQVCNDRSGIGCFPHNMRILAASSNHGILCCTRRKGYHDRYYVCKLTTQQWQPLPNPKLRYPTAVVGMVVVGSNPLRYKIVRLSRRHFAAREQCYVHQCEVFDSKLWRWHQTQTVNLPYGEQILVHRNSSCVYVHGSFHWLTSNDNVFAFHDTKQCFHKFPLPVPMHYTNKQLVDYQGELGLSCEADDGKIELWVMEDTQRNWRKEMVVDLKNLEGSVSYPSPAGFYNAGIILLRAFGEAVFYKVQDGSYNKRKLDRAMTFGTNINTILFRSDFERVDLRQKVG